MYTLIILIATLNGHATKEIHIQQEDLLTCDSVKMKVLDIPVPSHQSVIVKCVKSYK